MLCLVDKCVFIDFRKSTLGIGSFELSKGNTRLYWQARACFYIEQTQDQYNCQGETINTGRHLPLNQLNQ